MAHMLPSKSKLRASHRHSVVSGVRVMAFAMSNTIFVGTSTGTNNIILPYLDHKRVHEGVMPSGTVWRAPARRSEAAHRPKVDGPNCCFRLVVEGAVEEGIVANREAIGQRQRDRGEGGAVAEGTVADGGEAGGEGDAGEGEGEGVIADGGEAGREVDGDERGTAEEGFVADGGEAGWEGDMGERGAAGEGASADGGEAGREGRCQSKGNGVCGASREPLLRNISGPRTPLHN